MIGSSGVDSMLIRDNFPELGTDLIPTLSSLNVNDFSHFDEFSINEFEF